MNQKIKFTIILAAIAGLTALSPAESKAASEAIANIASTSQIKLSGVCKVQIDKSYAPSNHAVEYNFQVNNVTDYKKCTDLRAYYKTDFIALK